MVRHNWTTFTFFSVRLQLAGTQISQGFFMLNNIHILFWIHVGCIFTHCWFVFFFFNQICNLVEFEFSVLYLLALSCTNHDLTFIYSKYLLHYWLRHRWDCSHWSLSLDMKFLVWYCNMDLIWFLILVGFNMSVVLG